MGRQTPAPAALRGVQSSRGPRPRERPQGAPCGEPSLGGPGERTCLPERPGAPLPARVRPQGCSGCGRASCMSLRTERRLCPAVRLLRVGRRAREGGLGAAHALRVVPQGVFSASRPQSSQEGVPDAHTRGPQEGGPWEASQGDEGLPTAWGLRGLPPLLTPVPPHRAPTAATPAPSSRPRSGGPGASPPARAPQPASPQTLSSPTRTGPPPAPGVGSASWPSQEAKKGPAASSGAVGAGAGSRLKPEAPLAKGKSPQCGRGTGWAVGVAGSPGSSRPACRRVVAAVPSPWSCFTARLLGPVSGAVTHWPSPTALPPRSDGALPGSPSRGCAPRSIPLPGGVLPGPSPPGVVLPRSVHPSSLPGTGLGACCPKARMPPTALALCSRTAHSAFSWHRGCP